jgi:hypothetical protein
LDWRLQAAALASGFVMASMPAFIPSVTADHAAFVTSVNTIISLTQYILVAGLILTILGIVWKGRIGQRSALWLVITSIVLGVWMVLSIFYVQLWTNGILDDDCCRDLIPALAPAQNLLWIGLLIPVVTFWSFLVWVVRDNNRKARPALTM